MDCVIRELRDSGGKQAVARTNLFYLSLGFREFEVFPALWDPWNPCQIYVMALN